MKKLSKILTKYGPTALAVLASAGVVATAVFASKDAIKAAKRIEVATDKKPPKIETTYADNEPLMTVEHNPLTKREKFLAAAPAYIPTAIMGAATIACIFGSTVLSKRSQVSLMSAYALVNTSYNRYRKAAKEVYGEDADIRIKEKIAADKFNKDHMIYDENAFSIKPNITGPEAIDNEDQVLFYEPYTERYFWSTVRRVTEAKLYLNKALTVRGNCSIGQFLEYLGLPVNDDSLYLTGWNAYWFAEMTGSEAWLNIREIYTEVDDKVDEDGNDIPSFYTICYEYDPILNHEDYYGEVPF